MKIAQEVMTKEVASISPHAAVAEAVQVMHDRRVTSLLVERRSPADTWGIISQTDIVRNIVAEANGGVLNIDSRPSDALAIAVRAHVPILVARTVMDTAGIIPEEDLKEEEGDLKALPAAEGAEGESGEERLSVFKDFLEGLDLEDLGNDEEQRDDE